MQVPERGWCVGDSEANKLASESSYTAFRLFGFFVGCLFGCLAASYWYLEYP